jgi:hypothetical protein
LAGVYVIPEPLDVLTDISGARSKQPPEDAHDAREEKLAEETNVYDLMQTIRREIPDR